MGALLLQLLLCCMHPSGAAAVEFNDCSDTASAPELKGSVCSTVQVPLRARGPVSGGASETLYLFVRKFPAARAAGTVWLVAGGPGESGATFYPFIATLRRAFPDFDLLIPDHRGTGYSTRLCPTQESIGSLGGGALVGAEKDICWRILQSQPEYAKAFSISNAAHDLADLVSQYHGTGPTYVYGVSYGTQLILRALRLESLPVQGVVLDSLIPAESASQWDLGHRAEIVNAAGIAFLHRCEQFPACRGPVKGSLVQAYAELLKHVQPHLLQQVPGGDLRVFFGGLLDEVGLRERIPQLIDDLARGKTDALTAARQALDQQITGLEKYMQSPLSLPLISIISASENFSRSKATAAKPRADSDQLLFATTFPELLFTPKLPLYVRDEHFGDIPKSLPRTLVLHGTLDPKTPFSAAQDHVAMLKGSGPVKLVAVTDSPHFILMSAPECVVAAVTLFRASGRYDPPVACTQSMLAAASKR